MNNFFIYIVKFVSRTLLYVAVVYAAFYADKLIGTIAFVGIYIGAILEEKFKKDG